MTATEALNLIEQFVSDEVENRARCLYVKSEYVANARRALAAVQFLRKESEKHNANPLPT